MAKLGGNTSPEPIPEPGTTPATPDNGVDTPSAQDAPVTENIWIDSKELDTTNLCTINDKRTPILILFGPSQCGKSMTMVRLVRYLRKNNFTVEPRKDFRPSNDKMYEERCEKFNNTIATYEPLPGTSWQDYMLATVYDQRDQSVLQILEGPGEAYFSSHAIDPVNEPFPAYLNTIKNESVPKIWCFFIEPDWVANKHALYIERIKRMQQSINLKTDRIIFLYNKVDKTPFIRYGKVNEKALIKFANQQYPGLFEAFKNKNVLTSIYRPYLCEFVSFTTGDYSDGRFSESNDIYPRKALNKILKRIF